MFKRCFLEIAIRKKRWTAITYMLKWKVRYRAYNSRNRRFGIFWGILPKGLPPKMNHQLQKIIYIITLWDNILNHFTWNYIHKNVFFLYKCITTLWNNIQNHFNLNYIHKTWIQMFFKLSRNIVIILFSLPNML